MGPKSRHENGAMPVFLNKTNVQWVPEVVIKMDLGLYFKIKKCIFK